LTEEVIDRAASLQALATFIQGDRNFRPEFNPRLARQIVMNDPLVSAAIETEANKALEGGWSIKSGRKADNETYNKNFKKKYRFDRLLHTAIRHIRFQDALIEIARKEGEVVDLNLLDPAEIEVDAKPNGDVNFYYQEQTKTKSYPSKIVWQPENIVHIKFKDNILNFWGDSDLQVAYETVLVKDFIRKFLNWLFGTNQFRNHVSFKQTVSEQQLKTFISYYKEGEKSYGKPAITDGDVEIKALRELKDLEQLQLVMDMCDRELMRLLQQTPLSIGDGGSSGRSESDGLSETQRTSIKSIKRLIADAINYDLFPKLGYPSTVEFYWHPIDRMSEKSIFEVVEIMKRSMFTDEAIMEWMENQGLEFTVKKLFKEPELPTMGGQPTPEQRSKKDASASRTRKGEGESSQRIGTGEEGTTREEQVSRAIPDFTKFPYVIEKEVEE
jgi:hypothetical protein